MSAPRHLRLVRDDDAPDPRAPTPPTPAPDADPPACPPCSGTGERHGRCRPCGGTDVDRFGADHLLW